MAACHRRVPRRSRQDKTVYSSFVLKYPIMTTELTAEQRLEQILLALDSLDRFEIYMMLEELRDENTYSKQLADYGLDRALLEEQGVTNIIKQLDDEWNNSINK